MRYTLLLISDGRDDYLARTVVSALENLPSPESVIHIDDREHRLGFGGAIQAGWDRILETDAELVVHLEGDFLFNERIDLESMAALVSDPHISQVALKRQAWNEAEKAAGGIVELDPDSFAERKVGGIVHTVSRRCFTTNPCLYTRKIMERGWPQEPESEGKFGLRLFNEDPETVSCFLGGKFDSPKVHHIGVERSGHGY